MHHYEPPLELHSIISNIMNNVLLYVFSKSEVHHYENQIALNQEDHLFIVCISEMYLPKLVPLEVSDFQKNDE